MRRGVHFSVLKVLRVYLMLGSISYQEGLISNLKSLVVTTGQTLGKSQTERRGGTDGGPYSYLLTS